MLNKKYYIVGLLACVAAAAFAYTQFFRQPTVVVNNITIKVIVAETVEERTKGLSGRRSLAQDTGMLFVFDELAVRSFWMKDMLFPIDIIWITDGEVVGVTENVALPQGEDLPVYLSPQAVNYVLEVNAGFAKEKGIRAGDKIELATIR